MNGIGGEVQLSTGSSDSDSNIGGTPKLSGGVSNLGRGGSISAEAGELSFGFGGNTKIARSMCEEKYRWDQSGVISDRYMT
jgi:hypothetical protein